MNEGGIDCCGDILRDYEGKVPSIAIKSRQLLTFKINKFIA